MPGFHYGTEPLPITNDNCWVQRVSKELPALRKGVSKAHGRPQLQYTDAERCMDPHRKGRASVPLPRKVPLLEQPQPGTAGEVWLGLGPADGKWKWWRSRGQQMSNPVAPGQANPSFLPLGGSLRPHSTEGRRILDSAYNSYGAMAPGTEPNSVHRTHSTYARKEDGGFYKTSQLGGPAEQFMPLTSSLQSRPASQVRGVRKPGRKRKDPQEAEWVNLLKQEIRQLVERHMQLVKQHSKFCLSFEPGPKFRIRGQLEAQLGDIEKQLSIKRKLLEHFDR